ncbi:hypothetical protein GCM10010207_58520 [Streptomyces atratus]|nr:hypothetical protein GCM10010207_58520 [Streptomyces atratus]
MESDVLAWDGGTSTVLSRRKSKAAAYRAVPDRPTAPGAASWPVRDRLSRCLRSAGQFCGAALVPCYVPLSEIDLLLCGNLQLWARVVHRLSGGESGVLTGPNPE